MKKLLFLGSMIFAISLTSSVVVGAATDFVPGVRSESILTYNEFREPVLRINGAQQLAELVNPADPDHALDQVAMNAAVEVSLNLNGTLSIAPAQVAEIIALFGHLTNTRYLSLNLSNTNLNAAGLMSIADAIYNAANLPKLEYVFLGVRRNAADIGGEQILTFINKAQTSQGGDGKGVQNIVVFADVDDVSESLKALDANQNNMITIQGYNPATGEIAYPTKSVLNVDQMRAAMKALYSKIKPAAAAA